MIPSDLALTDHAGELSSAFIGQKFLLYLTPFTLSVYSFAPRGEWECLGDDECAAAKTEKQIQKKSPMVAVRLDADRPFGQFGFGFLLTRTIKEA
jgi:hypothetical protein